MTKAVWFLAIFISASTISHPTDIVCAPPLSFSLSFSRCPFLSRSVFLSLSPHLHPHLICKDSHLAAVHLSLTGCGAALPEMAVGPFRLFQPRKSKVFPSFPVDLPATSANQTLRGGVTWWWWWMRRGFGVQSAKAALWSQVAVFTCHHLAPHWLARPTESSSGIPRRGQVAAVCLRLSGGFLAARGFVTLGRRCGIYSLLVWDAQPEI